MLLSCAAGSLKQSGRIRTVKTNHTNTRVPINCEQRHFGILEVDNSGATALTGDNSGNSAVTDINQSGHKKEFEPFELLPTILDLYTNEVSMAYLKPRALQAALFMGEHSRSWGIEVCGENIMTLTESLRGKLFP